MYRSPRSVSEYEAFLLVQSRAMPRSAIMKSEAASAAGWESSIVPSLWPRAKHSASFLAELHSSPLKVRSVASIEEMSLECSRPVPSIYFSHSRAKMRMFSASSRFFMSG